MNAASRLVFVLWICLIVVGCASVRKDEVGACALDAVYTQDENVLLIIIRNISAKGVVIRRIGASALYGIRVVYASKEQDEALRTWTLSADESIERVNYQPLEAGAPHEYSDFSSTRSEIRIPSDALRIIRVEIDVATLPVSQLRKLTSCRDLEDKILANLKTLSVREMGRVETLSEGQNVEVMIDADVDF